MYHWTKSHLYLSFQTVSLHCLLELLESTTCNWKRKIIIKQSYFTSRYVDNYIIYNKPFKSINWNRTSLYINAETDFGKGPREDTYMVDAEKVPLITLPCWCAQLYKILDPQLYCIKTRLIFAGSVERASIKKHFGKLGGWQCMFAITYSN